MSLVILGKEDLNTLTDWAIEKFSAVLIRIYLDQIITENWCISLNNWEN